MMKFVFISILLLLTFAGCQKHEKSTNSDITLSGMIATFPRPLYNILFSNYSKSTGRNVIANAYNSEASIRALQDKTVDFAGTDALPSDEEYSQFDSEILTIPACLGAIAITYNIPGISNLNLSGPVLADIYLQNIKYWDDPAIQSINSEINLPHKAITTIHRADGSGASYVFSDYLCKVSSKWKEEMGKGKSLNWKNGVAVRGCLMVAGSVAEIEGSIGYTSWEHTVLLNISIANICNSKGNYIQISKESILAAADRDYPDDLRVMITNSSNEKAYPISCFSWILVYKNQAYANRKVPKYEATKSLLNYIIDPENQKMAAKMQYVPLPQNVIDKAQKLVDSMEWTK